MTADREIVQCPSPDALAQEAANRFVSETREAIGARERALVALSGGSTPRAMYQKLAQASLQSQVDWEKVHLFFSDERFVPSDSTESNYHTANAELISKVPIPRRNVHPYTTVNIDPAESARQYEERIRQISNDTDSVPRFDLIFLGMGPDGHTASLFPNTNALTVRDRLVVENFVAAVDMWRLTFTYTLLNAGRTVMFLVQGADKAPRVREILSGDSDLPAGGVQPTDGTLLWLLDNAAAAEYEAPAASGSEER